MEFSGRLVEWRPCLGDVCIIKSELSMAEVLLAEACTHDDAIKQLKDNVDFVVVHSRQGERKPAKDAIMVSIHYIIALTSCTQAFCGTYGFSTYQRRSSSCTV